MSWTEPRGQRRPRMQKLEKQRSEPLSLSARNVEDELKDEILRPDDGGDDFKYFVGPLELGDKKEIDLINHANKLKNEKRHHDETRILISDFALHPMSSSVYEIFKRDPDGRPNEKYIVTGDHYYIVLWVQNSEDYVLEHIIIPEFTRHFVDYRLKSKGHGYVNVIKLDTSCLYITGFGQASCSPTTTDYDIAHLVGNKLKKQQIYEFQMIVCAARPIQNPLSVQKEDAVVEVVEDHPQLNIDVMDEKDEKEDDSLRASLLGSVSSDHEEDVEDMCMTIRDSFRSESGDYHSAAVSDSPRSEGKKDEQLGCRFAIVQVRTGCTRENAIKLMEEYHQKNCFDEEQVARFELFGYDHHVSASLSHERISSMSDFAARFVPVFLKTVLYPIFSIGLWLYDPTCAVAKRIEREESKSKNFRSFQDRLQENPARIFRCFRRLGRNIRHEKDYATCGAVLGTICLWLPWTILAASAAYGATLFYRNQNDKDEDLLTYMDCFFPLMGYLSFSLFISTWIAHRKTGVNAFEHQLLFDDLEVYWSKPTDDDEHDLTDFRVVTALHSDTNRVSLLQFMYEYRMLQSVKFSKSPFSSICSTVRPLPNALTNNTPFGAHCFQMIRNLINFLFFLAFILTSKSQTIFYHQTYGDLKFIVWFMVVNIFWFAILMWMSETVFGRMARFLNCIDTLSILLTNKLDKFYLPMCNSVGNIRAWGAMRCHLLRTGEMIFSSIEINCLFIALGAFFSLCSAIWCYFFGHGASSQLFSNAAFNTWLFLTVILGMFVARILYGGYQFANAQNKVIRRLVKHKTDFPARMRLRRPDYADIARDMDNLVIRVQNDSIVPKLFGRRVDGLLFPTLCISLISSLPTILTRIYAYSLK